ncbi:MAG: DUF4827 domain-containing protein [Bacteroidales bacterium]|nr:DUF4827 domain-containing protein [Bacteroidales bacterium]
MIITPFRMLCTGAVAGLLATFMLSSCSDSKSYAELLTDEMHAVNTFLANQNVILEIPADNDFQVGPDAPFYRLDEEGNIYMQVLSKGDPEMMAEDDDLIYFRFTRSSLYTYDPDNGTFDSSWGNSENLSVGSASFRFNNYTLSSSSQWGAGLQAPLIYLGMFSRVNLVIKSQYGLSSEISQVVPFYYYDVRYFPPASSGEFEDELSD